MRDHLNVKYQKYSYGNTWPVAHGIAEFEIIFFFRLEDLTAVTLKIYHFGC